MNQLRGIIEDLEVNNSLSLVRVRVGEQQLSAIVIDTPETLDWLRKGGDVGVVFKETEVVLGTDDGAAISLQNRIPGSVASIEQGQLLSRVVLDTSVGPIASVITSRAVTQLGLKEGASAVAFIKTNEVMLEA